MALAWFGSRIWEGECLCPWLDISFAFTLEESKSPIPGISLEQIKGERQLWGSANLFDSALQEEATKAKVCLESYDSVLSYAPLPSNAQWPPNVLWTAPPSVLHLWEDKIHTREWFSAQELPNFPAEVVSQGEWPSSSEPMVLQSPSGSCGTGTFMGDGNALRKIFAGSGWPRALVGPLIDCWIINGHIAVFPDGRVEVPWPSIQMVDAVPHEGCVRPFYAGNDFLSFQELVPIICRLHIKRLLFRLGELAAEQGYVGILGADLMYRPSDSQVGFLEVNARLQGSTGLLSKIEASQGYVPLAVRTFQAMLGHKIASVDYSGQLPKGPGSPVSQYLLREGVMPLAEIQSDECVGNWHGKGFASKVHRFAVRGRMLTTRPLFSRTPYTAAELVRHAMGIEPLNNKASSI